MPGRTSRSGSRSGCARSCRCVSMSRWLRPEPSRAPSTKPSVSSMNDGWPPAAEYRDHPPGAFGPDLARGSLKGLGLDGPTLRERFPHLVITLVSGYGQQDSRVCMDTIAQCESGFAMLNGDEDGTPRLATGWPVDMGCGMVAGMCCA